MNMKDNPIQNADIVFNAKPDAVPYNYRISYKVSQLCLILRICGRGNICSLVKIHMISFALISQSNMDKLVSFVGGDGSSPIVRFDPAVNRALEFAIAYGFVEQQKSGKYKLTDSGERLAEQIGAVGDLMVSEILNLNVLAKKLTESMVEALMNMWRESHVKD
jgi:hypothetical protein